MEMKIWIGSKELMHYLGDIIESRVRRLPSDFALHIQGEWIPCGVWEGI